MVRENIYRGDKGDRGDQSNSLYTIRKVLSIVFLGSLLLPGCAGVEQYRRAVTVDNPETGKQGESLREDKPGTILEVPYSKGVNLIGHSDVWKRDSNIQMSWAGDCAYIASSSPNFLGWGVTAGPETFGVAVVDVSNPASPKAVRALQDRGALYSAEAMDAADTDDRKVLVAGIYEGGSKPEEHTGWVSIYDVSDCKSPILMSEFRMPETIHALTVAPNGKRVYATHIENPSIGVSLKSLARTVVALASLPMKYRSAKMRPESTLVCSVHRDKTSITG